MIPLRVLNLGLAVMLLASLGVNWAVRWDPAAPNSDFFPDMVRTARYNAFAPNPNFADGGTLQRPEPGTAPRDLPPLHYQSTPRDAVRAGDELRSPVARDDAGDLARGTFLFTTFCRPCHGQAGRGDGAVVARGFPAPLPLTADHAANLREGQIFHIVTYGQGNMASYASQLSRDDRWKVILFVRSLQKRADGLAQGGRP